MSKLFSPLTIKKTTFKNRIGISSMCMYSSSDGFANDFHLVHLGSRAIGGAGLVMQEATAVSPEGRITTYDLGLWKDEHIEKLKQVVTFIHDQGALAGIQLAHAGRKASCVRPWEGGAQIPSHASNGWKTVAPSAVPFKPGNEAPLELDKDSIEKIKQDFHTTTRRAKEIGYEVAEIHGAHGYLLHQFCSPLSNHRSDEYGGSFENRVRLMLEITDIVKSEWGNYKPLFVRLSATDWVDNGWTVNDTIELSRLLKQRGVDLIDTSSGGNIIATIPTVPGYQVEFAEAIKKQAGILTGAVGLITSARQAESIIDEGKADLVLIARQSLRDPYFPLHAAAEFNETVDWPVQYVRAKIK